jgi:hypothetical protein
MTDHYDIPLAALSYAMATLLHRLSEGAAGAEGAGALPDVAWARAAAPPSFVPGDAPAEDTPYAPAVGDPRIERYACEHCGAALPDHGAWMHMRRWGGCERCRPQGEEPPQEEQPARQTCPRCGTAIPDPARWRAARRWGRCAACREEQGARG